MASADFAKRYNESILAVGIDVLSKFAVMLGLGFGGWAFNRIEQHSNDIVELRTMLLSETRRADTQNNQIKDDFSTFQIQFDRRFAQIEKQLSDQNTKLDRIIERGIVPHVGHANSEE